MALLPLQNLRCDVVGRAADGFPPLVGVGEARGQAQVSHLDPHARVDEEVPELQVSVNDQVRVQVLERADELAQVVARLKLGQLLAALQ